MPQPPTLEVLAERIEGFRALVLQRFDDGFRHLNERLDQERIQDSEHNAGLIEDIKGLRVLQKEQNGNVSKAMDRIAKVEGRQDGHDKWHGENNEEIEKRLETLWSERSDSKVRQSVLMAQWKLITASLTTGGAIATAAMYVLGSM